MNTDFSSLEILQKPEVYEDQLKLQDFKYLETFDGYYLSAFLMIDG